MSAAGDRLQDTTRRAALALLDVRHGRPITPELDVYKVAGKVSLIVALPGQPGLNHAARQISIRNAILTSQVRQLEAVVGTALLRTGPDGRLALTAYGQLFARDVRPALESLARSRKSKDDNHETLPRAPPRTVHLPGNQPAESCSTTTKHPAHGVHIHVIPTLAGIGDFHV